jgi:hypothetical protein
LKGRAYGPPTPLCARHSVRSKLWGLSPNVSIELTDVLKAGKNKRQEV